MHAGPAARPTNWAGNVVFTPDVVHRPRDVDELRRLVVASEHVHALGTGHSFSPVADSRGTLVSLSDLPAVVEVSPDRTSVVVGAGMTFAAVVDELERQGLALENMGSLPHICVAGAASTGTHGSGDANRCLAATVREVELVTAGGDLLVLDRDDPRFGGAVLALGRVGVMTRMVLDVVPSYEVAQTVWEGLGWDALLGHLDEVMACAYSVSVFTTFDPPERQDPSIGAARVFVKHRTGDAAADLSHLSACALDHPVHPTPGLDPASCTVQGGVPGRWCERLPHFSAEGAPSSSGAELQSEWYVDREHGAAAVEAVREIGDRIRPVLQVAELRSVAGDDLWLSPAGQGGALGLHVTWLPEPDGVARAIAEVEAALAPFAPRPHWGKVFGLAPAEVRSRFPRWDDFASLVADLDPDGVFGNDFTDAYLRR
jgi:xylitol oxidase